MAIKGIHHFSFTVSDLERTVDFYGRLLGFRLVGRKHRQASDLGDALLGPAGHLPTHGLDSDGQRPPRAAEILIADMELEDLRVEFIQYVDPAPRPYPGDPSVAGSAHLALLTEDIEAEVRRLEAAGVQFHTPVRTVHDPGRPLWRWCYFRDPDGIVVELVQSGGVGQGPASRPVARSDAGANPGANPGAGQGPGIHSASD